MWGIEKKDAWCCWVGAGASRRELVDTKVSEKQRPGASFIIVVSVLIVVQMLGGEGWVAGMLPGWCCRAGSFKGELAPIRTECQLNYSSYTGIISISFSHLMLSPLFCSGRLLPSFFALTQELDTIKSLTYFPGALCFCSVSLIIRLFRILKQLIGSSFFSIKPHLRCRGWAHFFASLTASESDLSVCVLMDDWKHFYNVSLTPKVVS